MPLMRKADILANMKNSKLVPLTSSLKIIYIILSFATDAEVSNLKAKKSKSHFLLLCSKVRFTNFSEAAKLSHYQ